MATTAEGLKAEDSHQPPVNFEKKHGLTGISGGYTYPDIPGWDWYSLDKRFDYFFDRKQDPELFPKEIERFAKASSLPATAESVSAGGPHRMGMLRHLLKLEHQELTIIFARLAACNPEACAKIKFNPDKLRELSHAVQGIVSGMNTDDINYFIARERPENRQAFMPREHMRMQADKKIIARLGLSDSGPGWIACPATQQKIWDQIKQRPMSLDGPDEPPDQPLHRPRPQPSLSR